MSNIKPTERDTGIFVDLQKIVDHFYAGKLKDFLEELLSSEEAEVYFTKTLYSWAEQKGEMITEEIPRKIWDAATDIEILWININLNLMRATLAKAIDIWLVKGGDLDDIIISLLTFKSFKMIVDGIADVLNDMFDTLSSSSSMLADDSDEEDIENPFSFQKDTSKMYNKNNKLN